MSTLLLMDICESVFVSCLTSLISTAERSLIACRRFDADGSGRISQKEVTQALRCLGVPVRQA